MIDNETKIAKICNKYFVITVKYLQKRKENTSILLTNGATFTENNLSEGEMALKKYKSPP